MFLRVRFLSVAITRRVAIAIGAGSLALCATPGRAAAPGFMLDSVLAAPFADELTASLHRDALVWTVHERGAQRRGVERR